MSEHKLKISDHKTRTVVLKNKMRHENIKFSMDGNAIMSMEVKYLAMEFDSRMYFKKHVEVVCILMNKNVASLAKPRG